MFIYKILLSFLRYTDNDFTAFVARVILALTGNPAFPVTSPTIAAIIALKSAFDIATANAKGGGKALKLIRDAARFDLEMAMRLLASFIEDHSNNIKSTMLEAGFSVYGGPVVHRTNPDTPIISKLDYGKLSGSADLKVIPVDNTDVYEFRYTIGAFGPDAEWIYLPVSTKSSIIIKGLELGITIWAQARCHNSQGISNWSDPAQLIYIH